MTIETPNSDTQGEANKGTETNEQSSPETSWWIDEGIPGVGNKPEWLGEKFNSTAELAKSYQELEKRVGSAPESYDFSKSKFLDPEYEPFKELQELAKSKRVPAEVMDKVLESVDKYMNEFSIDYVEERKKLGEGANEKLTLLNNWAKANLSEASFKALTGQLNTAEAVQALDEIRSKMMSSTNTIPNGNESGQNETITEQDIQDEMTLNLDKYKTDPKYRAELRLKMERVAKNSNSRFVDKMS